jgi:hypothetical protein
MSDQNVALDSFAFVQNKSFVFPIADVGESQYSVDTDCSTNKQKFFAVDNFCVIVWQQPATRQINSFVGIIKIYGIIVISSDAHKDDVLLAKKIVKILAISYVAAVLALKADAKVSHTDNGAIFNIFLKY